MAVSDAYVFPDSLTPVLTQHFFPKPLTTFLTCFCRGEMRKHAGKKVCLNRRSNSQPPGHESNMLTTEPPGWGNNPENEAFFKHCEKRRKCWQPAFSLFPTMFSTHPKGNFFFQVIFILSSANAFNLDQSKKLSFGKGLNFTGKQVPSQCAVKTSLYSPSTPIEVFIVLLSIFYYI